MGEISTNIWNLSESALKSLKKSDSIQKILDLIGKVVIDADLHKLCEKVERLTESMNQIVAENKKLQSQIAVVKNINRKLEDKIVYLEKNQAKRKQYSRRNNVEISVIPNSIPDKDLENTVIRICSDSGLEIDPKHIEGCYRLPLSRNSRGQDKRVIVKLVNRKHSQALLETKNGLVVRPLIIWMSPIKFLSRHHFARYIWVKCKDLQRQGQVNHVFCLGGVVCIKLPENGSPIKLYRMNDVPEFPSESGVEN